MKQTDLYPVRVGDTLELTDPKTGEPIFVTLVDARDGLFRIEVQAPPTTPRTAPTLCPAPPACAS